MQTVCRFASLVQAVRERQIFEAAGDEICVNALWSVYQSTAVLCRDSGHTGNEGYSKA